MLNLSREKKREPLTRASPSASVACAASASASASASGGTSSPA